MATYSNPGGAVVKKPSWTGIIWAIVIFVVTSIAGIVLIVIGATSLVGAINDFREVDVPGQTQVALSKGEQWIFVGRPDGSSISLSEVGVRVIDPEGDRVTIDTNTSSTYSANSNDDSFDSIGKFDAAASGTYTIDTVGPAGAEVRIGKIPFAKIAGFIGGGIILGGLGFVIALVILIVALVRRSRVKKANRAAAWAGPGGPGGAPAYGQPGGEPYLAPGPPPAPPGPFPQPYGTASPAPPAPQPAAPAPPPASPPPVAPPTPPAPAAPVPPPAPPAPPTPPPPAAPPASAPPASPPPPTYPAPGSAAPGEGTDPSSPGGPPPSDSGPSNPA